MKDKNKLSEILDYVELNHDNSNSESFDNHGLNEVSYLFRHLDERSLLNVISALSKKCDLPELIKENAPDVYNKHVMDPEMVADETTGIDLLDDEPVTSDTDAQMDTDSTDTLETFKNAEEFTDFSKIAKFAPIRLNFTERKLMRLLDSTLHVSEYTDKVDIIHEGSKTRAIIREIKEVSAILSGLAIAYNYEAGQKLLKERDYYNNAEFFRNVFEIGRRYKILNPDKMRNSYGKLIYFLMDSRKPEIKELLNFDCVIPINTVYTFLKNKRNGLEMLADPKLKNATKLIVPDNKSRYEIDKELNKKDEAIKYFINKYAQNKRSSHTSTFLNFSFLHKNFYSSHHGSSTSEPLDENELSVDDVENALYSLSDYNSHLRMYRTPIDKMIKLLKENYHPNNPVNPHANSSSNNNNNNIYNKDNKENKNKDNKLDNKDKDKNNSSNSDSADSPKLSSSGGVGTTSNTSSGIERFFGKYNYFNSYNNYSSRCEDDLYNLSINSGHEGSRLTHRHGQQYLYVLQSLHLWREIAHQMFSLWHKAESDLLSSSNEYRLRNTGQGLNRVQEAPSVLSEMRKILKKVQNQLGSWIGSHAIHLGDHNVPNAFLFIDKYTQIPRILTPIVSCIEKLPELYKSTKNMRNYIDGEFGSLERLKMTILSDFFRHAFDGSGADNFNDAGSCIDGRLTSAWNWCSKIEKKSYFNVFLLTGFNGFDGRFND